MTGTGRVILYRRVSALMGRGGDDFHSPEMQTAAMRKHAAANGLRVVAEYEDIDVSGRSFNREGLSKVRDAVTAGRCDVVAVYDVSRLGRNTSESLAFIKWLASKRVSLVSTRERIDDTPEGKLALTLWLGMAEWTSNRIGTQWSDVVARRTRQGIQHASTPPLGYRWEAKGQLVPDPVAGPAVAAAIRSYARGGVLAHIRDELGAALGRKPSKPTVKRLMWNPVYLGKVALWDRDRSRNFGWRSEPTYVGDGVHEALIDQETWDACQRRIRADAQTAPRLLSPVHSLAGLAVCAECSATLVASRDARYSTPVVRLKCSRKSTPRFQDNDCGGCGQPRHERVEAAVLEEVREWVAKLRLEAGAARRKVAPPPASSAGEDLGAALEEVEKKSLRLVQKWLDGKVPDAAYEATVERLAGEEAAIRARMDAVVATPPAPTREDVIAAWTQVERLWPEAQPPERRAMLGVMVERVRVRPAAVYREDEADRVAVDFRTLA